MQHGLGQDDPPPALILQGPCGKLATNAAKGERLLGRSEAKRINAIMLTCGTYDAAGDFAYRVGLPGKSGIGGGIVTVSPGKGALGTFAPPLDQAGNSLRGVLAAKALSHRLGLDLFMSKPAVSPSDS